MKGPHPSATSNDTTSYTVQYIVVWNDMKPCLKQITVLIAVLIAV